MNGRKVFSGLFLLCASLLSMETQTCSVLTEQRLYNALSFLPNLRFLLTLPAYTSRLHFPITLSANYGPRNYISCNYTSCNFYTSAITLPAIILPAILHFPQLHFLQLHFLQLHFPQLHSPQLHSR